MVTTRGAVAILAVVVLTVAILAMRLDYRVEAAWLLTMGFGLATVWGILSVLLAEAGEAAIPRIGAISLTTMAAVTTMWFLLKAVGGEPVEEY